MAAPLNPLAGNSESAPRGWLILAGPPEQQPGGSLGPTPCPSPATVTIYLVMKIIYKRTSSLPRFVVFSPAVQSFHSTVVESMLSPGSFPLLAEWSSLLDNLLAVTYLQRCTCVRCLGERWPGSSPNSSSVSQTAGSPG
ncbi:unnamed protein product [Caretta caretta]